MLPVPAQVVVVVLLLPGLHVVLVLPVVVGRRWCLGHCRVGQRPDLGLGGRDGDAGLGVVEAAAARFVASVVSAVMRVVRVVRVAVVAQVAVVEVCNENNAKFKICW